MKVNFYKEDQLCWIVISPAEAIRLINSLTNQMIQNNPNCGRMETFCDSDSGVKEMSIAVVDACEDSYELRHLQNV